MLSPGRATLKRRLLALVHCTVTSFTVLAWPCCAADLKVPPHGYLKTTYTSEEGLDSNVVNAITQTRNGILWIGTTDGLLRFDGHEFLAVTSRDTTALAQGKDGDLWTATNSGLLRVSQQALDQWGPLPFTSFHLGEGAADLVDCLLAARDGTIWAGSRQGIYRFNGRSFQLVLPRVLANRLEEALNGNLLIIGSSRFLEWNGKQIVERPDVPAALGVSPDHIFHAVQDSQGAMWYATLNGLFRVHLGSVKRWVAKGSPAKIPVYRIYNDHTGTVFVSAGADLTSGVYRVNENALEPVDVGRGGRTLYGDRDGDLWIGTNGSGLIRVKPQLLKTYSSGDGLPNNVVAAVLTARDGKLWAGYRCGGVSWFDDNSESQGFEGKQLHVLNEKQGLNNSCVTSLAEDEHNDLLVGTPDGLFRLIGDRFSLEWRRNRESFAHREEISSIVPLKDGSVWLATASGVVHVKGRTARVYTVVDGLSSDRVVSVYQDRNATIWVGTAMGIDRVDGDKFVRLSAPAGEARVLGEDPLGRLYAAIGGEIGRVEGLTFVGLRWHLNTRGMLSVGPYLWFIGNEILREPIVEMHGGGMSSDEPSEQLTLSRVDGLTPFSSGAAQPQIAVTKNRNIWFAQFQGLTMLDPSLLLPARPVAIAMGRVTVDKKSRPPGRELDLTPGRHHIELSFNTIELSSPERTKLQYKLDDVDSNWFDATPTHSATYVNIPVGTHGFHVRACNRDGIWNREGIVYSIIQRPYYYETGLFRLSAGGVILLLVAGLYNLRLRQVAAQLNAQFHARTTERERIARELHDTLLQGYLSASLQAQAALGRLENDSSARAPLSRSIELMARASAESRVVLRELRSSGLEQPTLEDAFSRLPLEYALSSDTQLIVRVEGRPRILRAVLRNEVYRIGREAIVNAFGHSAASKIDVDLEYTADWFRLLIQDDGRGIDPQLLRFGRDGHWGLQGMRERAEKIAGKLSVRRRPGAGTEIVLTIPARVAFEAENGATRRRLLDRLFPRRHKPGKTGR